MAKWNISVVGNQLTASLNDGSDRKESYSNASADLANDLIKVKSAGTYQRAFSLSQIGNVGGESIAGLSIGEVYDMIIDLIPA